MEAATEAAAASEGAAVDKAELLTLLGYACASAVIGELVTCARQNSLARPHRTRANIYRHAADLRVRHHAGVVIYRHEDYARRISKFLLAQRRLAKKKEEPPAPATATKSKSKDRKQNIVQYEFEVANRDLIQVNARTSMLAFAVHALIFFAIKDRFDGVIVARLPFMLPSFLRNFTQYGLNSSGVPPTACSMAVIYILCAFCIKPNLQKLLGHSTPKTAIPLGAQRLAERLSGLEATK